MMMKAVIAPSTRAVNSPSISEALQPYSTAIMYGNCSLSDQSVRRTRFHQLQDTFGPCHLICTYPKSTP
eukprot:scaffold322546_cov38-Prasinocladus_malaysianus.AAC.2